MQGELLDSPVANLRNVQLIIAAAIDGIDRAELFRQLACLAEPAGDFSVQIDLVNLAVRVYIFRRIRIGTVERLTRPRRDANRRRGSDILDLGLEVAVAIKHLNATHPGTRVFAIPGNDFAAYRWGDTIEPITPGLTDRPYAARELIPYGTPGTADLLDRHVAAQ